MKIQLHTGKKETHFIKQIYTKKIKSNRRKFQTRFYETCVQGDEILRELFYNGCAVHVVQWKHLHIAVVVCPNFRKYLPKLAKKTVMETQVLNSLFQYCLVGVCMK